MLRSSVSGQSAQPIKLAYRFAKSLARPELSSSRIHQLLNAPEGKEIPVWLSRLRQSSRGSGEKKKVERPESETEIGSRLAREVEVLRRCTDWLQRLERGESVVVNLRPDEDVETEFVAFDRPRVVRSLRIPGTRPSSPDNFLVALALRCRVTAHYSGNRDRAISLLGLTTL